ncbi:uncharacterized protein PAC_02768 [Phialocephala subalpina]|uniref:Myb-like domain-containing protein n=1 Tax=Phialocephala subalpina TaxID=576137 RepID=A0A1L7WJE4_9HELO|nr:uncharacterized protein PAC_02768 [Phialocephala subalpina]
MMMMMMMMMMIDGTTRSTSEPGPTLCLNCWMRTVEERLSKSKEVVIGYHSQLPPGLLAALLSHRTLGLINAKGPRPARWQKLRLVAIEALPATQLEIDKYHLRLPRIYTRQLAGRRTPIVNGNFTTLLAKTSAGIHHADSRPASATAEASPTHRATRIQPQHGTAVNAEAITSQRSKPFSLDDDSGLSNSDRDLSSGGDGCSSEDESRRSSTRKHIPWDLDEQRLLAYKKEDQSWEWIFDKFPGRTRPAIRTRWNMVRPRGE